MKKGNYFLMVIVLISLSLIETVNGADLLFPMKIGQKFILKRTDSANPPNTWHTELTVIKKEIVCSNEYFKLRITNYNIGETAYFYARSTEDSLFSCDVDSGIEGRDFACEQPGKLWIGPDGEIIEALEPESITIPYGGPFTACVNRKHTEEDLTLPYWYGYTYMVPGLGYVKEVDWWNDNPPIVTELVEIEYSSNNTAIPLLLLDD